MSFKLPTVISHIIFRANDIRGDVEKNLTPDVVYAIGLAIGSEAKQHGQHQLVIAHDGRLSAPLLDRALIQGLNESGCDVIDIDAVPTPFLYFATRVLNTAAGVMLTGSHNPSNENGLKIILQGKILTEGQIRSLYKRIQRQEFFYGAGQLKTLDIVPIYFSYLIKDIQISRKLKVAIDCGNGIAGKVAPEMLRKLGCDVIELFCDVDGNFPHHFPDPSVPENLKDLIFAVQKYKADIGFAFDGDGDRLGVVTNKGKIIWPDRQLMLFTKAVLAHNPGATILYDVKCTQHLETWVQQHGGKPLMWKTGHSFIEAKLQEIHALLAGEMSGHFFFADRWFGFDDALYAAARLLEIISSDNRTSEEIFTSLPDSVNTPEIRVGIADEEKFKFIEKFKQQAKFKDAKINTLDGVRVDFIYGFGLVRASNTSPCLVLRFEADTEKNLNDIKEKFRKQLLAVDSRLLLPF